MEFRLVSMSKLSEMEKKSLDSSPDETLTFEKGKVEIAKVGDTTIGRGYFEPGWSWEKSIKPIAKTDSCQLPHTHYVISGRLKVALDDGTEEEFGRGDVAYVPPGHNSWVVGNEPLAILDFSGFKGQK
jgi:EutQ-like cupin domain